MISNEELVKKLMNELGWNYTLKSTQLRPPGIHSVIDKNRLIATLFRLVHNFAFYIYICEEDVPKKADRKRIVDKSKIWTDGDLMFIFRDGDSLIWRYGAKEVRDPDLTPISISFEEYGKMADQGLLCANRMVRDRVKKLFGVKNES